MFHTPITRPARTDASPVWLPVTRGRGRPPKHVDSVLRRYEASPNTVYLLVPTSMLRKHKVNFFEDGGTRLAVAPDEFGRYLVNTQGRAARSVRLPSSYAAMVPFGQTQVTLTEEHGMLVIDFAQFGGPA